MKRMDSWNMTGLYRYAFLSLPVVEYQKHGGSDRGDAEYDQQYPEGGTPDEVQVSDELIEHEKYQYDQ
jgi:hypothetical protein